MMNSLINIYGHLYFLPLRESICEEWGNET